MVMLKIRNAWDSLAHKIEWFFSWVVKSFQYAWFLRNDHDWDYDFFLDLMRYKLSRMRKTIKKNQIVESADKIAEEILHAEQLLEKILDRAYVEAEWEKHKEKWGEWNIKRKLIDQQFEGEDLYAVDFSREKATTPALKKKERSEFSKLCALEKKIEDKTYKELFEHLQKNMRGWWD